MKGNYKKLISLLLCSIMAFGAVLPAFAAGRTEVKPTWQDTIDSVTPVGDEPFVKLELTAEGYKITECRLPRQYDIVFKDGTKKRARIADEPSHFAPLEVYENYFDVETPEGTVTLYAKVMLPGFGAKEAYFSVGQYMLDGSLGDDGIPVAGSMVYEFPIIEEPCEAEIDEGGFITKILFFLYSLYHKIESWIVYHFSK